MKLLLDTHTFLWLVEASPQLSATAATLAQDPANDLFLSMASVWELAIKSGMGKLTLATPYSRLITDVVSLYKAAVIDVTVADCIAYQQLPFPDPKHRDPFDRMIAVHAARHGLTLVSNDVAFDAYGVARRW